jgi:hypothetical protein
MRPRKKPPRRSSDAAQILPAPGGCTAFHPGLWAIAGSLFRDLGHPCQSLGFFSDLGNRAAAAEYSTAGSDYYWSKNDHAQ